MLAHHIIESLAQKEQETVRATFLAPCVRGGTVCTRIDGIVQAFTLKPSDHEGWGMFRPNNGLKEASFVEEPALSLIDRYLHLFTALRVRLVYRIEGQSWLAFPVNSSDASQKFGKAEPMVVHLVEGGNPFQAIIARHDGSAFWFHEPDTRANPVIEETLLNWLNLAQEPHRLQQQYRFRAMTPEDSIAYELAWNRTAHSRQMCRERRDRERLQTALHRGGGQLKEFFDRDDYWLVTWQTHTGEQHSSAIRKKDLTVVSAGICLDDNDEDFDLQSLVAVVEKRPDWMR